ncbi:hypothetical protein [Flavobacterium panacagri]|uniref:hypothetical protein n=1 Tax=Flavobacterium panacagri TaxID=3034146 RepID=UPI0025A51172|nr:hypothetical protein [Flavobacterium panacagri]
MRKKTFIYLVFPLLFMILISCKNDELILKNIKSGFLYEAGIYTIPSKNRNILIKELKDGSLLFAIRNSKSKILFQQSLDETFSPYHYWMLYVDNNANVWYYNSDYISSKAILFNEETQQFTVEDFCSVKLQLPLEFKKRIKSHIDQNCQSLQ